MAVKVLIVDDSAFFRKRLSEILQKADSIEVAGTASNGKEALQQAKALNPDVITMDYEMPVMDGITAIRHIMKEAPCPILMFSSLTHEGARVTLDALDAGAVDFLPKNFEDIARDATKMQDVLTNRILSIARKNRLAPRSSPNTSPRTPASSVQSGDSLTTRERLQKLANGGLSRSSSNNSASPRSASSGSSGRSSGTERKHPVSVVAIGTSTGGPVALQKVVTKLPASFPVPILLIQHMPATFTPAFAERLNALSAIKVKEAEDGDVLQPGCAYLAPGGKQMLVGNRGGRASISILDGDERLTYKPSVDLTFGSVSKSFPGKVLSIVLTGMGADGKEGCRLMKSSGSTVWTQTEATCVVYGMPMAVDKAGYSDKSLDINDVAEQLVNRLT
ncbi:chemotaxis response regulator protein-glutamate methylesterase [Oleiphilus sp. HI0130]|uniref:protein-glutamate methylesterase/protein-glutamine glutaminase n=2 Tax=Oleiphilus sp. HI0079 TaxID=1822254 RepID=UPI0007C3DF68|nr:chemotaxis response regulator protein-glutamate methylesterase [Oleiphilus sp. HI0079]KZZ15183.1 chemotaxis response regulator protein-glutamate methylesterase [Oleiphilus sp. HI0079]KZZ69414.1 chemotaxis response regulator protein-glutamate methylesterase [Oleiphilus sp. HI0130]